MRPIRAVAVLLAVVLAGTAAAAGGKPRLVLKKTSNPPKTVRQGDDFVVKTKVKNNGTRTGRGRIRMFLVEGPGDYALPARIGKFPTGRIGPNTFKRYTVRLTVPPEQGAGRYVLRTCLLVRAKPRVCRDSRRLRVTAVS